MQVRRWFAVVVIGALAVPACGGGSGNKAASTSSTRAERTTLTTERETTTTESVSSLPLASIETVTGGTEGETVAIDATSYPGSISPCGHNAGNPLEYVIPPGYRGFRATLGLADNSASDAVGFIEIFVDGRRFAQVESKLGTSTPVAFPLAPGDGRLSLRAYSVAGEACGSSGGLYLGSPKLVPGRTTAQNAIPDALVTTYPGEGLQSVDEDCDSFYFHDDVGTMDIDGQHRLHVVSAGRDGDIGKENPGPCWIEYDLSRAQSNLEAVAGISDKSSSTFTCAITISGDGKQLYHQAVVPGATAPVALSVANVLRLRLTYTFGGPGYGECALAGLRLTAPKSADDTAGDTAG